jgi:hypothetical protein
MEVSEAPTARIVTPAFTLWQSLNSLTFPREHAISSRQGPARLHSTLEVRRWYACVAVRPTRWTRNPA